MLGLDTQPVTLADVDTLRSTKRPFGEEDGSEGGGGDTPYEFGPNRDRDDNSCENDDDGDLGPKKRKVERAKKACLPCRSRKCKCGGMPPAPCPNCLDDKIQCQWPTEDGRSSQARKERSRAKRLASMAERGLGRPPPKAQRGGSGASQNAAEEWDAGAAGPSSAPWDLSSVGWAPLPATVEPTSLSLTSNNVDFGNNPFTLPLAGLDGFDPEQFIMAMSAQLPTVEEGSSDDTSPAQLPHGLRTPKTGDGRIVKITWWRPHGPTAIAPGLKRLSLKVRIENEPRTYPSPAPGLVSDDMFGTDGMPVTPVMQHLLDVFSERFGCQFPALEREALLRDLEAGSGSVFLFNCIAAMAARFSEHPAIALAPLQPHEYGNIFLKRAKDLLPNMLAVPSRETVIALCLLGHICFGNDSEPEEWMYTGMAVRMAIDMGLHLKTVDNISPEERRMNRLTFWSVMLLDYALAFGTGRQTTFRVEEITQDLPTEEDVHPNATTPGAPGAPFPFAARQMFAYGTLINLLNAPVEPQMVGEVEREITALRAAAVAEYNTLPEGMQWSVANLQAHRHAHQDSMFLHIHLWMHMQIASAYLTGVEYTRHPRRSTMPSGHQTPVCGANVWRNSARTIGDMLVLADVINPYAYLALPFVNQAFYVAGCCYIKEIENKGGDDTRANGGTTNAERLRNAKDARQIELFRTMLTSVATTSISTLQQGLARQTTYWSGVAWVAGTLAQRISGIHADELDITEVQEQLQTYISIPDAGLVQRRCQDGSGTTSNSKPLPQTSPPMDISQLDLMTLRFDLPGMSNVTLPPL